MEKIKKILIAILLFISISYATDLDIAKSKQIIVVITDNWNSVDAKLYLYNKIGNKWKNEIKNIDVVLGHKGLAWGRGLHSEKYHKGKIKKEGDSCASAGIFKIYRAFGYLPASSWKLKVDYFTSDSTTFCIDDPNSKYYNQLVDIDTIKKIDWKSKERLRLRSDAYKYCIVVEHNTKDIIKGAGSCIFIHLWIKDKINHDKYEPTMGCTSISEDAIIELLSKLDKKLYPIIIQLPFREYNILRKIYNFPAI